MIKNYYETANTIIKATDFEDFYEICNSWNYYLFQPIPEYINNFLNMLNKVTKVAGIKKAKEFLAFLEAGSFYGSCVGCRFDSFSLPSRRDIRVTDRNSYTLESNSSNTIEEYYDTEKCTIKVVFDGTKWYIKSIRVISEEYYDDNLQKRNVYWF